MKGGSQVNGHDESDVWKGLVAGLAGGLVASWTMNQFQAVWSRVAEGFENPHEGEGTSRAPEEDKEEQDDATVKAARAVSEGVFGH